VIALAVVLAVLAGFIVRLVDIQVVNADANMSQAQSYSLGASRALYGTRGSIVDETGQPLAGSILRYDAQLSPSNAANYQRVGADGTKVAVPLGDIATEIAAVTGQTPEEIEKIVTDALKSDPDSQFAYLKKGISTEEYRALADLGLPFVYFDQHPARTYADGAVAGNLVGFMGVDAEPLAGLELTQDSCLASTDGVVSYEKGKDGVIIPGTEKQTPAVDGGTLQLTINRDLQWYLQQLIGEQVQDMGALRGTITVVEVGTGKIRAAAEYPSVDPNDVDAAEPENRYSHIFSDTFEPGSTFKGLTGSTVLDAGGATLDSTVWTPWSETFANGARVRDSFSHPDYNYTLAGVLIDSSNSGISHFSETVSTQTRYEYLQRFGIGSGSAVGFEGEAKGYLVPYDEWDNQQTYNTSFGQGVTTTVPELVGAYDAIANGGTKMPLSLVESCTAADGTVATPALPPPTQVMSAETSSQMRSILENVALQASYADQVAVPGYRIATKTGTGEKSDGNGHYKAGVYFTTMIGFAPADDPQYLVAVTLDEPTKVTSSSANAPAFQKAMTQVLKTYRVMPSTAQPVLLPKFG
jgi:cell division protein FtsI (penicillin-binding protein 3)